MKEGHSSMWFTAFVASSIALGSVVVTYDKLENKYKETKDAFFEMHGLLNKHLSKTNELKSYYNEITSNYESAIGKYKTIIGMGQELNDLLGV